MDPGALYLQRALELCKEHDVDGIRKMLEYLGVGKMIRYKLFSLFSDDAIEGYNLEIFQNLLLIQDDIMDVAETRRKQPCYHLVASTPIRDAFFLFCLCMKLSKRPLAISRIAFRTGLGQILDMKGSVYTKENYQRICIYKTGYYTFYMPLLLAGVEAPQLERFCQLFGIYFQMIDDAINFDTPDKSSTDLVEYKVTWFSVRLRNEFYGEEDVAEYFTEKVLSDRLVSRCYTLCKSEAFKESLAQVRAEIAKAAATDPALQKANDFLHKALYEALKRFN